MISTKFIVFLIIGTLTMLIPLLICSRWKNVSAYKAIIVALVLTVVGTAGTYLLGLLENQFQFGSRSFYGAVYMIPAVFPVIAVLLRIRYGDLMDMSAPSVCAMLVLMKALCLLEGCCGGIVMWVTGDAAEVVFPSQIVELVNALILFGVLLHMAQKTEHRGTVYPWFLVLYGVSRFLLNFFRADLTGFVWFIPAGHLWSMVAVLTGALWIKKSKARKHE